MFVVDGQGILRALGESLARLVGQPSEELTDRPLRELLPEWQPGKPDDKACKLWLPRLQRSVQVEVACEALRVAGEVLFAVDITTPSRRAAGPIGEAIMLTDPAGVIVHVNAAFEAMTGYGRAEARGCTPAILKSGVEDAGTYAELWSTLLAGECYRRVLVNRRKDCALYREQKIIRAVPDADGSPMLFFSSGWALAASQPQRATANTWVAH